MIHMVLGYSIALLSLFTAIVVLYKDTRAKDREIRRLIDRLHSFRVAEVDPAVARMTAGFPASVKEEVVATKGRPAPIRPPKPPRAEVPAAPRESVVNTHQIG